MSHDVYQHSRLRFFLRLIFTILAIIACMEAGLRCITVKRGHIEYVFGQNWHYLVPFEIPDKVKERKYSQGLDTIRYDPLLGWVVGENIGHFPHFSDQYGFRTTEKAYREQVTQKATQPLETDIAVIGDSFSYGHNAIYEQTWPYLLSQEVGKSIVNMAVNAYAIDQALLRFKHSTVRAKYLILGMIPEDFERSSTAIFGFTRGELFTKPMFVFEGSHERIINQPCIYGPAIIKEMTLGEKSELFKHWRHFDPKFLKHEPLDFLYLYRLWKSFPLWQHDKVRAYREPGPDFNYVLRLIDYGNKLARERDAKLVVLLMGSKIDMNDYKRYRAPWALFESALKRQGVEVINAADRIYEAYRKKQPGIFVLDGHYDVEGYKIISECLAHSTLFTSTKPSAGRNE